MKTTTFIAMESFLFLSGTTAIGGWDTDTESISENLEKDQTIQVTCKEKENSLESISIILPNQKEYELYDGNLIGRCILTGKIKQVS